MESSVHIRHICFEGASPLNRMFGTQKRPSKRKKSRPKRYVITQYQIVVLVRPQTTDQTQTPGAPGAAVFALFAIDMLETGI
jgi:hypothetical protein